MPTRVETLQADPDFRSPHLSAKAKDKLLREARQLDAAQTPAQDQAQDQATRPPAASATPGMDVLRSLAAQKGPADPAPLAGTPEAGDAQAALMKDAIPSWMTSVAGAPYEFARKGIGATLGLAGDLQHVGGQIGDVVRSAVGLPPDTRKSMLPLPGSQTIAGALPHVPEEEQSFLERGAGTLGEFVVPGLATAGTPELRALLSAGPLRDALMGTAAVAGGEIGRRFGPGGETAGKMVGPLGVSGLEMVGISGLRALGHGTVPELDAMRADAARRYAEDTARANAQTTKAQTTKAAEGVRTSTQAQRKTFDPLAPDLATRFPTAPALAEAGTSAQRSAEAGFQAEQAKIADAHNAMITKAGGTIDRMALMEKQEANATHLFASAKKAESQIYQASEAITGDTPVVKLAQFHPEIKGAVVQAAQSGQPLPSGARTMAATSTAGEAATEGTELLQALQSLVIADPRTTLEQRKVAMDALASLQGGEQEAIVPFWLARRMKTALNQMGYPGGRGSPAIGNTTQQMAKRLGAVLQKDIDTFYATAEGSAVAPLMEKANAAHAKLIDTYNDSAMKRLVDRRYGSGEEFTEALFKGTGHSDMLMAKETLSPDVWQATKAWKLADMFEKAHLTPNKSFSSDLLWQEIKNLEASGKAHIFLEPPELAAMEANAQRISALDTGLHKEFRAALAKRTPEQVVPYVFAPGVSSRTQQYKSITSPAQFDESVKAWAGDLQRQIEAGNHVAAAEQLKEMAKPGAGGLSQLDHMLVQYPGLADTLKDASKQYTSGAATIEQAKQALHNRHTLATRTKDFDAQQIRAATDAAREARIAAHLPEEGVRHVQGRFHLGGLRLHTGATGAGVLEAATAIVSGQPAFALAGLGMAAGGAVRATFMNPEYLAAHPQWEQFLRTRPPTQSATRAMTWATQALAAGTNPPEEEAPTGQ